MTHRKPHVSTIHRNELGTLQLPQLPLNQKKPDL